MRRIALILLIGGMAGAQTMTEFGAAAAGSTVGGASGKAVSDGISGIFGKVNQQAANAAGKGSTKEAKEPPKEAKQAPALPAAPGVARDVDAGVPPPPPETGRSAARTSADGPPALNAGANAAAPFPTSTLADAMPAQPIPPPPAMTPEGLKQVVTGMSRADLLKLGDPSAKIAMFDGGHYVETFSYWASGQRFGRVRLEDGAVVTIEGQ